MHDVAEALLDAVRHQRAGRRTDAAALCRGVLEAAPNQPNALFLSGLLALADDQPAAAARLFARAVAADPCHQGARINLARALLGIPRSSVRPRRRRGRPGRVSRCSRTAFRARNLPQRDATPRGRRRLACPGRDRPAMPGRGSISATPAPTSIGWRRRNATFAPPSASPRHCRRRRRASASC